jgi:FixJ family two-component response regulator
MFGIPMSDACSDRACIKAIIAIVDDHAAIRDALTSLLRSVGYEAVAFESGEKLLGWNDLADADCILMDIKLPGISGLETQRRLTAAGVRNPVIGMSAYGDAAIRVQVAQSGMVAFFEKPVPSEELLDGIAVVIAARPQSA